MRGRMVMDKSAAGALFLIVIMLGSTFTMGLLQAFNFGATGHAVKKLELPKGPIVDRALSAEEKDGFVQKGMTVMKFSYSLSCAECSDIRAFLEDLAKRHPGELILSEITYSSPKPELIISNLFSGEQEIYNITEKAVLSVVCHSIIEPQLCA